MIWERGGVKISKKMFMFFGSRHHVYARKSKHFFGHFETPPPYRVTGKGGGIRWSQGGHMMVTKWSLGGQNHKIMISVYGQSILVNGILYLGLFNPLDITSSKYRNDEFNFVSCSNLRRSLGIMYNMLIHGPTRFWPLWCLIGGFIRGFSHPTRHTGLRENAFFGFQTRNLECIKEK